MLFRSLVRQWATGKDGRKRGKVVRLHNGDHPLYFFSSLPLHAVCLCLEEGAEKKGIEGSHGAEGIELGALLLLGSGDGADNVRVSGIGDGEGGDGKVLSASSSELNVV